MTTDLVTTGTIARLAGVSGATVDTWRRHADFPQPDHAHGTDRFQVEDVARWLDRRSIAGHDLVGDEVPGTSYGVRFRRNLGSCGSEPGEQAPAPASRPHRPAAPWEADLRRALDRLREYVTPSEAGGLLLSLLYLRIGAPTMWPEVLAAAGRRDLGETTTLRRHGASVDEVTAEALQAVGASLATHGADVLGLVDRLVPADSGAAAPADAPHLFDLALEHAARLDGLAGFLTPASLVRLLVELVDPRSGESVCDPCCGSGEILVGVGRHRPGVRVSLFGQALTERSRRISRTNLAVHGLAVQIADRGANALLDDLHAARKFDVIVTNPPFNMSRWGAEHAARGDERWVYGPPSDHNANFAWLQHVLAALKPGGRAAVVMPNSASSTEHPRDVEVRAGLVDSGALECVIALPPQLFTTTAIPVSLWLLTKRAERDPAEQILLVDATSLGAMRDRTVRVLPAEDVSRIVHAVRSWRRQRPDGTDDRGLPALARAVPRAVVAKHNWQVNPRTYVATRPPDRTNQPAPERLAGLHHELRDLRDTASRLVELVRDGLDELAISQAGRSDGWSRALLGDLATVTAGPSGALVRLVDPPDAGVPMVVPRCVRDNRISDEALKLVDNSSADRLARYRLIEGDVVCVRTGEPGRAAAVTADQAGWLVGTACLRIRPADPRLGRWIAHYLSHPTVRDWIARDATGSVVRSITAAMLTRLPVLVPPSPRLDQVCELLGRCDNLVEVHTRLRRVTSALRDCLLPLVIPETLPDSYPDLLAGPAVREG